MNSQKLISRVLRSQKTAQWTYDRMSTWYDNWTSNSELPLATIGSKQQYAISGEKILEIGCGIGHKLVPLAKNVGKSGMVVGIDLSKGMLTRLANVFATPIYHTLI